MNQDRVKEILLETEDSELEFSVVFTGKASKKVNGLYKPDTHEIILHNKNFANDNELIYTAVHEYTHHKQCEKEGGFYSTRVHTPKFWSLFHTLLEKAEQKGFYKLTLEESPELLELTEEIKQVIMIEDGKLIKELGLLLIKARTLCKKAGVRYEDYIDRVLCLPRPAASTMEKISAYNINPNIGSEAMKIVANIGNPDKRAEAEELFLKKNSPAAVKGMLSPKKEDDPRKNLEKEKRRIEKTILSLQAKLENIESKLANMSITAIVFVFLFSAIFIKPVKAQNNNSGSGIPQIPNIEMPKTADPLSPVIPKPFKQINTETKKNKEKKDKNKIFYDDMLMSLNDSKEGKIILQLMNSKISGNNTGDNILNKIVENLSVLKKTNLQDMNTQNKKKSAKAELFKINGQNILNDFSSFDISELSEDGSFFAVGKTIFKSDNEPEEVYIFAKKSDNQKYKLFVKVNQSKKDYSTPLYRLMQYSPFEAELVKNMIITNSVIAEQEFILIFNMY